MNRATFQTVCKALWGPYYGAEAARELGVARKTVMRWKGGETSIPDHAWQQLLALLRGRRRHIDRLIDRLEPPQ